MDSLKKICSVLFIWIMVCILQMLLIWPIKGLAATAPEAAAESVANEKKINEAADINSKAQSYAGFNWGVGIGFSALSKKNIVDASVVNGKVRVNKEERYRTSLMLESHYYFTDKDVNITKLSKALATKTFAEIVKNASIISESHTCGIGPFMAIQLADLSQDSGNALNVFGAGIMGGCKRIKGDAQNLAWNLGIGAFFDKSVKLLGDGLEEGQPLPGTETQVRFKEENGTGFLLMFSASF